MSKLPFECLQTIFHELDEKALYSSILVNRAWCQIAIPLLWSSPFHFLHKSDNNYSMAIYSTSLSSNSSTILIQTYLRCFPEAIQASLIENGLMLPPSIIQSLPPLFPYDKYIRSISYSKMYHVISEWFESEIDDLEDIDEREGLEYLVTEKLIRLFISSSLSITDLSLTDEDGIPSLPPISLFPNAENSLSKLVKFTCIGDYQYNMKDLFISLTGISRNIKEIIIGGLSTSIEIKLFGKLIKSQRALKSIEILGNGPIDLQMISLDILQPLKTQQYSLENIRFMNCDFEECATLYPITFLPMLKSIEFEKCRNLALQDLTSLDMKKLPKLQIFKTRESYIPPYTLEAIICNSHESLRVAELSRKLSQDESRILLSRIPSRCTRLEVLDIRIYQEDIGSFLNLLKYCENLRELTVFGDVYAEELLPLIALNLRSKHLQKLCFIGRWVFSKTSMNTFLQGFKSKEKFRELQVSQGQVGSEITNQERIIICKPPKILKFQSNDVINNDHLDVIVDWVFSEKSIKNGKCDLEKLELVWCQKLSHDVLQRTKCLYGLVVEIKNY
ncbi:9225_t:CDS:1 [Funneliformis mosseae]|uniref:9225_t:CDS:1 n=1 Tax=Funneliformis mosseae TaxID=27381 RepID=A0A9N9GHK0_FUNMO|nr:9225_t:CDS:1 [Funneliformis mosseae]